TRVLPSRRGIWLCHRCVQIVPSTDCQLSTSTVSGSTTSAAMAKLTKYQRRWAGWDTKCLGRIKTPRQIRGVDYNDENCSDRFRRPSRSVGPFELEPGKAKRDFGLGVYAL